MKKSNEDFVLDVILALDDVAMTINLSPDTEFESADDLVSKFNNIDDVHQYLTNKYNVAIFCD